MSVVNEVPLPGIGVGYEFVTLDGDRVAVVYHRSGVRELMLFERDDLDTSHDLVRLGPEDSRTLAELLGVSQIAKELSKLEQASRGSPSTARRVLRPVARRVRTAPRSHRQPAGAARVVPRLTGPRVSRSRGWLTA